MAIMVHFSKSRGKFDKVGLSSIHSKHEKKRVFLGGRGEGGGIFQRSDYSLICNMN